LGAIIRSFKSAVTKRINAMRDTHGTPVWQRNYYEHVIRNKRALQRIREYIANNPLRWDPGLFNSLTKAPSPASDRLCLALGNSSQQGKAGKGREETVFPEGLAPLRASPP